MRRGKASGSRARGAKLKVPVTSGGGTAKGAAQSGASASGGTGGLSTKTADTPASRSGRKSPGRAPSADPASGLAAQPGSAAIYHPSPNHGERRGGLLPDLIVLHYTAMGSARAAIERLCDPVWEVSAHWLIGRDGRLWSLVPETRRAWHAGAGSWGGRGDLNSRSIGIEIDNDGRSPFSAPAMATLERLLPEIMARWSIPPEGVIGHSDLAPRRKADPGPRFDWQRLARLGLAVWPGQGPEAPVVADGEGAQWIGAEGVGTGNSCPLGAGQGGGVDPQQFLALASAFGWPADQGLQPVLTALRLRFRPSHSGPLDAEDCRIAGDLARRHPLTPG